MKLPKDLEAIKDKLEFFTEDNKYYVDIGFNYGATAVLEHEQIKKLEEACEAMARIDDILFLYEAKKAKEALADFRTWRDSK